MIFEPKLKSIGRRFTQRITNPISRFAPLITFSIVLFVLCPSIEAQQSTRLPRLGFLSNSGRVDAFVSGLRELGYVEGKSIVIEHRHAGTKVDQLPEMARDLARLKVDVIFAMGTASIEAAKEATTAIPLVISSGDPILSGLVSSLARPGGNVTGLTNFTQELAGKRLELLKEVLPQMSRVAVLWTARSKTSILRLNEIEAAARFLDLQPQPITVQAESDLDSAFSLMKKERAGAFVIVRNLFLIPLFGRIIDLAAKHKLAAIYDDSSVVRRGGLMSYGADMVDLDRRAAGYVDKILKGAAPADLPVEQPTKFEFVVNLKTAETIGLRIPGAVLRWADTVIR
jgi:putative ABC transport system substrate-binding protein